MPKGYWSLLKKENGRDYATLDKRFKLNCPEWFNALEVLADLREDPRFKILDIHPRMINTTAGQGGTVFQIQYEYIPLWYRWRDVVAGIYNRISKYHRRATE